MYTNISAKLRKHLHIYRNTNFQNSALKIWIIPNANLKQNNSQFLSLFCGFILKIYLFESSLNPIENVMFLGECPHYSLSISLSFVAWEAINVAEFKDKKNNPRNRILLYQDSFYIFLSFSTPDGQFRDQSYPSFFKYF
jgi:hypothetical protein